MALMIHMMVPKVKFGNLVAELVERKAIMEKLVYCDHGIGEYKFVSNMSIVQNEVTGGKNSGSKLLYHSEWMPPVISDRDKLVFDTKAATYVNFSMPLGYKFVILSIFAIAVSNFVRFSLAATHHIIVVALGVLSTTATGLEIDAYIQISDPIGGMAEMADMSHKIVERTDALNAAVSITNVFGKGIAINFAAISNVDVLTPKVFVSLIETALLSYWFSVMTTKGDGGAAMKMLEEVHRLHNTIMISIIHGSVMLGALIFSFVTAGSPVSKELFYLWMTSTIIYFYIGDATLVVWIAYRESSWTSAFFWILLLILSILFW